MFSKAMFYHVAKDISSSSKFCALRGSKRCDCIGSSPEINSSTLSFSLRPDWYKSGVLDGIPTRVRNTKQTGRWNDPFNCVIKSLWRLRQMLWLAAYWRDFLDSFSTMQKPFPCIATVVDPVVPP
jgi:hypothetical protein